VEFEDTYLDAVRQTLRQVRQARGITMREVGERAGVAESVLSRLETGGRATHTFKFDLFLRACVGLNISPAVVLDHAEKLCAASTGGVSWTRELPEDMGTINVGHVSKLTAAERAERDRNIVEDYRRGIPIRRIAALHGVDLPVVNKAARRAGLSRPPGRSLGHAREARIVGDYFAGFTYPRIAQRNGVSAATVGRVLQRHDCIGKRQPS
jgi:transcriptional regulator with XRE-family HTH domain